MDCNQFCSADTQVSLGEIPLHLKMRKAYLTDVTELETLLPDASAANRALELLGRELNRFTEKKEVGKPGDFDCMADEELIEFIEAQGEIVGELLPHQRRSSARVLPSMRKMPLGHGMCLTRVLSWHLTIAQVGSAKHGPSARSSMRRSGQRNLTLNRPRWTPPHCGAAIAARPHDMI